MQHTSYWASNTRDGKLDWAWPLEWLEGPPHMGSNMMSYELLTFWEYKAVGVGVWGNVSGLLLQIGKATELKEEGIANWCPAGLLHPSVLGLLSLCSLLSLGQKLVRISETHPTSIEGRTLDPSGSSLPIRRQQLAHPLVLRVPAAPPLWNPVVHHIQGRAGLNPNSFQIEDGLLRHVSAGEALQMPSFTGIPVCPFLTSFLPSFLASRSLSSCPSESPLLWFSHLNSLLCTSLTDLVSLFLLLPPSFLQSPP